MATEDGFFYERPFLNRQYKSYYTAADETNEQPVRNKRRFDEVDEDEPEINLLKRGIDELLQPEEDYETSARKRIRHDMQTLDPRTIRLFKETGCILWGKGLRFIRRLLESMEPHEVGEWNQLEQIGRENPNFDTQLRHRFQNQIEALKTEQFFLFVQHYQELPETLHELINQVYPDFPTELEKIINQSQDSTYFGMVLLEIWTDLIDEDD